MEDSGVRERVERRRKVEGVRRMTVGGCKGEILGE